MRFEDRVTLVTGARTGVGAATAARLVAEGGAVTLVGHDHPDLHAAASRLSAQGPGRAMAAPADVAREGEVDAAIEATVAAFGRLDGVVTSAAVFEAADAVPVEELQFAEWLHVIEVNLGGTYLTVKHALPHMEADGGSIVLLASIAALTGVGGHAAYTMSKGGIVALTRLIAAEYAPQVRANCICPGGIDTPMTRALRPDAKGPMPSDSPLQRVAEAEEIASTVAFALSDDASYMTGATLVVDGGSTIH